MPQETSRHRVLMLLLAVTTSSAVVAWFALKYTSERPMSFEKERWMQARKRGDSPILNRMARDLVQRKTLIGESRSQLIELLGAPEKYSDSTERQMYYLIREDWDGVDPVRQNHLLISLDQNQRAVQAQFDAARKKPLR